MGPWWRREFCWLPIDLARTGRAAQGISRPVARNKMERLCRVVRGRTWFSHDSSALSCRQGRTILPLHSNHLIAQVNPLQQFVNLRFLAARCSFGAAAHGRRTQNDDELNAHASQTVARRSDAPFPSRRRPAPRARRFQAPALARRCHTSDARPSAFSAPFAGRRRRPQRLSV